MCAMLVLAHSNACALQATEVFQVAASSSVVIIVDEGDQKKQVLGSGVVVAQGGIVATNCHLFRSGQSHATNVSFGGQRYSATIVESRRDSDICILNVPGLHTRVAAIAPMENLKIGQRVYAVGAPLGLELTLTEGLVSGVRLAKGQRMIQTSAPISPGSSGGGLFDEDGRLIGITTFMLRGGSLLNFAVPADVISPLLALLPRNRDLPAPRLVFDTDVEGWSWLADMSSRLAPKMPDWPTRRDFLVTLQYEASRAGLDPQLILALVDVVSGFKKTAVGPSGARGYMQVAPSWVKKIGSPDQDLFALRTNFRYGCTLLRYFLDQTEGDLYLALQRYAKENNLPWGTTGKAKAEFPNAVIADLRGQWSWTPPTTR
jgi:hypothetical protein